MATREGQLLATLIELADTLVSDYDLLDYLDLLLERSRGVLGATAGGVLLSNGSGALAPLASSHEQMRLLELFEVQSDEGPCIDSYRSNAQVYEEDLARSSRWPRFTPLALDRGYGSVFAFPLRLREQVLGALNLFKAQPGPAARPDLDTAQAFADMATIGILQERAAREARALAGQLQTALNSRIVIEQAKGILAEHARLDMGDSWQALRWYARNHNLHLRHVAAGVVDGTLDADQVAGARPPVH
ncbi:MAG: GAF and ANTAR domain-containing protein [Egibacteraceae bacterium]